MKDIDYKNIIFPRVLISNKKGSEFIAWLWQECKRIENSIIVWDVTKTTTFNTNLLSAIGLILRRMDKRNNKIILKVKYANQEERIIEDNIISILFHKYSFDHSEGLQYLYFNFSRRKDILDDFLLNKLRSLNFKEYKSIKLILSEMSANIDMHANPREGSICSYINFKDNMLFISICNFGKTIKQNLASENKYVFESDQEAIIWALKKLNTTRKDDTSGGLGLYLLRKNIEELNGEIQIVSGKEFFSMKKGMYYKDDVNKFYYESYFMNVFFPGVMITIKIPNLREDEINESEIIEILNLKDI